MKFGNLKEITGKFVKEQYEWLKEQEAGCCSLCYNSDASNNYAVCVGWHDVGDGWAIAWKIGRQSRRNVMQCDFDVDFEMPYSEESGDVDDTTQVIEFPGTATMKEWNAIASEMRKEARRVWKDWHEEEDGE